MIAVIFTDEALRFLVVIFACQMIALVAIVRAAYQRGYKARRGKDAIRKLSS